MMLMIERRSLNSLTFTCLNILRIENAYSIHKILRKAYKTPLYKKSSPTLIENVFPCFSSS